MSIEEIKNALDVAWHEIGHAYAFVGDARFLAAEMAVDKALKLLKSANEALDKMQD